jgi:hypothetical protein
MKRKKIEIERTNVKELDLMPKKLPNWRKPKFLTKAQKQMEVDSLRKIAESYKKEPQPELHGLTSHLEDEQVDKLLDVLADIDLTENNAVKRRLKKICYAIVRAIDREKYESEG